MITRFRTLFGPLGMPGSPWSCFEVTRDFSKLELLDSRVEKENVCLHLLYHRNTTKKKDSFR